MEFRNFKSVGLVCFLSITLILFITSCSSAPTEDGTRAYFEHRINKESKGLIKLVSFKKTDGQKGEMMGIKIYNFDFAGEIEYQDNCKTSAGTPFHAVKAKPNKSNDFWEKFDETLYGTNFMKKGQKKKISGSVLFEKKESGWMIADTRIR